MLRKFFTDLVTTQIRFNVLIYKIKHCMKNVHILQKLTETIKHTF